MKTTTKAARRAALAIINSMSNPALGGETHNLTVRRIASIIDCETGLPELIQAAQDFVDLMDHPEMTVGEVRGRMEKALKRVKGGRRA